MVSELKYEQEFSNLTEWKKEMVTAFNELIKANNESVKAILELRKQVKELKGGKDK